MNGNIPLLSKKQPPMASSSSQFMGSGLASKAQSHIGRSITPTKGRATTSPSTLVPLKYICNNAPWISPGSPKSGKADFQKAKENVLVTIRFRPLSAREIQRGDEVAWYADGDSIVQSEYNPATMYVFDRVFGPATATRGVYDAAAENVVRGAMEGVNGTVFAYGVTSSGKTHTMHGDQKSPGIIPQAVKDVFSFIQETPGREFLLRVSYLEIYNEVINDLLDPTSQNLRIREDSQGTYVEGIKEEVILSPAHVLSLIAAGEEHRHVGSNNFNLLSSRSHTIFTLTIESSPCNTDYDDEEIALSQLNLIDLAGSESSRAETTGLRRKEGSYINKSLLTLGTVIAKLSDGKASHIPYRDSKLTRLLQSSLSGHGRVSLICTITPASGNAEETHNTLKFAHRAKRVEIHASANKILDEKSLIKKYQKEILNLKQELDLLRRGILDKPYLVGTSQEDLLMLRQQMEAGQVKMQSRLEEEEQAKEALLGRIQRLTKLILVSTKNSLPETMPERPAYRRRHSFGEEELMCLPDKRDGIAFNDDGNLILMGQDSAFCAEANGDSNNADGVKEVKKIKRRGMLTWLKHRNHENFHNSPIASLDVENSPNGSPGSTISAASQVDFGAELEGRHCKTSCARLDKSMPMADSFPESTQAGELFSITVRGCRPPHTGETMADHMDLLREQVKMLADEVAFCTSSLKRMSEQSASNPDDELLQVQIHKIRAEIQQKKQKIQVLEQRIIGTGEAALNKASKFEMSQTISKIMGQLNENAFELEIKTADNRILQEQLLAKNSENNELHKTIASLELSLAEEKKTGSDKRSSNQQQCFCKANIFLQNTKDNGGWLNPCYISGVSGAKGTMEAGESKDESCSSNGSSRNFVAVSDLSSQILMQAAEIEKLKQEKVHLEEDKGGLQIQSQKLAEEASYAKELASTAASELKILAEEVTKLSFQNAKMASDLATAQELVFARVSGKSATSNGYLPYSAGKESQTEGEGRQVYRTMLNGCHEMDTDFYEDIDSWKLDSEGLKRGLHVRKAAAGLEAVLADKEQVEAELRRKLEEAKQREADLENDLAGMWVRVAKLKKNRETFNDLAMQKPIHGCNVYNNLKVMSENDVEIPADGVKVMQPAEGNEVLDEIRSELEAEQKKSAELQILISQLKSEELDSLGIAALEDLQSLHIKALTKLCQTKARMQERIEKERERGPLGSIDLHDEERNGHVCKICFEAPTAAVLLPC